MSKPGRLRAFYLLWLSKPASDRTIYRELRRNRTKKILEIGIGTAVRTKRMLQVASLNHASTELHYTGIDLFEARNEVDGPGLSLRDAYRMLKPTEAKMQLVPGSLEESLPRIANGLTELDLIVISHHTPAEHLSVLWRYMPRMIYGNTLVYRESVGEGGVTSVERVTMADVADLVGRNTRRVA